MSTTAMPDGQAVPSANGSVAQIIQEVADSLAAQYGVDAASLYKIAMATMQQESGGVPTAIGDNGHSVGLFQLNDQGEGAGMSVAAREDPKTNATIAMSVIAQQLKAHPNWSPGQIAAAAQRPADAAGYANSVNSIYNGGSPTGAQDGATGAAPAGTAGASTNLSGGVNPNDPVALRTWVAENLGAEAWMLNIPELTPIVDEAASQGWDAQRFLAAVEQTQWWKTTTQAQQQYLALSNTNPAELDFTKPGSQANQKLATVAALAGQYGEELNAKTLQTIASQAMQYGWTDQQIQQNLATYIQYNNNGTSNAGGVVQQLRAASGQYLISMSDLNVQTWAQQIAAGTRSMNDFNAYLQQQAAMKYPGMAQQLGQGYTVEQIIDPLRQEAAKVLEISPDSIDFVNDPRYQKVLQYVPPAGATQGVALPGQPQSTQTAGQPSAPRLMTTSELDQYLKSDPNSGYQYTSQARADASAIVGQIVNMWGKAATQ